MRGTVAKRLRKAITGRVFGKGQRQRYRALKKLYKEGKITL
jgi:hypothetical protein